MTYSIVARDARTGEIGVAVQSHWFSVGSIVTWARSGVGAVATQSITDVRYGPLGLDLMSAGKSASEALDSLLKSDTMRDVRQVAMIDSNGNAAAHTGQKCIPFAGQVIGKGFSCQGNIMRARTVWGRMKARFMDASYLPLPERMLASLEAGEKAGGDIRGKQSAAMLVVGKDAKPNHWDGKVVDLRVDDSPEPLQELKRLLRYHRGYEWVNRGDELLASKKNAEALKAYRKGLNYVPEVLELRYWVGMSMLKTPDKQKGTAILTKVFQKDRNWEILTRRILKEGALDFDESLMEELRD